jgi:hypothetical protein
MAQSVKTFELKTEDFDGFEEIQRYWIDQWTRLHQTPNVFKYKLNVEHQKVLAGELKFLVQV